VATGGQTEIDQRFDKLVKSADNMMLFKYIVRNVANQYGKTVTFMPKRCLRITAAGCTCTRACGMAARRCSP